MRPANVQKLPSVLLVVLTVLLAGCNMSSSEATVEPLGSALTTVTPDVVAQPTAASTPDVIAPDPGAPASENLLTGCAPRDDWEMEYVVQPGDTLFTIAQAVGSTIDDIAVGNCLADADSITAYQVLRLPALPPGGSEPGTEAQISEEAAGSGPLLSDPNDPGGLAYFVVSTTPEVGSPQVGCETYLVPISSGIPFTNTTDDIRATVTAMFNAPEQLTRGINHWGGRGLTVKTIALNEGLLLLDIGGEISLVGACVDAAMEGQLVLLAFNNSDVQQAFITIEGRNMKQIFDASGEVDATAAYTREDMPR